MVTLSSRASPNAWDLAGRDRELAGIDAALYPSSGWAGVALVGAAGVGKTRLCREALARASAQGYSVGWVAATESARELPLGAFAGLLSTTGDESPLTQPGLLASAMRDLTGLGRRLLLGVDDAHLLDDVSAVLIQQLVLRGSAHVVATIRSGADLSDALASLLKDGQVRRLEISALPQAAMDELIDVALGAPVDRSARGELLRLSQGNPLYLRQLVDGGIDNGWLELRDGLWQASRGGLNLPTALSELVLRRIGAVSEDTGVLLDLLAIGEPLTLALVQEMVNPTVTESAETRGLVAVERVPGDVVHVRLAHPLYGEARRALLGTARARRLRGELAEAMANPQLGHSDDVLRRALIAIEGDSEPSLDLLLAAVQEAAALVDVPLAYRLARAALRAGAGFETQAYIANLSALTPGADPVAELDRLADMARDDIERARATVMHIAHLAWEANDPESAEEELRLATAALEDPDAIAHIEAIGALLLAQRGRPVDALAAAERLLTNPQVSGDAVVLATSGLVSARCALGKVDDLRPAIDRVLQHPSALGNGIYRGPLLATHAMGLISAGYLDDAEEAIRDFVAGIRDAGPVSAVAALLLGRMQLARGHPRTALPLLLEARSGFTYFGGWRYLNQIMLTQAQALSGTVDAAEDARRDLDDHIHPTMRFWEPDRFIAHSLVAARSGATTDALALCGEAVAIARRASQFANEVVALQQMLHLGSPRGTERLAELAAIVDGPRVHLALAHSRALAHSDALALADVSERWERCGDILAAAVAAVQSWRFADSAGEPQRRLALNAQRRAAELIALCESAWNPELSAFSQPTPLTAREREVVAFAGRGHTNKEIAARLHLSVRTVEGHVYRATGKLGMTRAEFSRLGY